MPAKTQPFKSFKGLQNTLPPHRLGLGWLAVADNVDVHSTGMVERRDGYQLAHAIPQLRFAFALSDYSAGVMVADGTAGHYRVKANAADAGASSTTHARIDGSIGSSGADLLFSNLGIVTGAPVSIDQFTFQLPAG